jgi:hypothetical protein
MDRHDDEDLLTTGDVAPCARTSSRLLALPGGSMSSADHRTDIDAARHRKDRALIARIAASERWGRTGDRSAATAPARHGLRANSNWKPILTAFFRSTNAPAAPTHFSAHTCSDCRWPQPERDGGRPNHC